MNWTYNFQGQHGGIGERRVGKQVCAVFTRLHKYTVGDSEPRKLVQSCPSLAVAHITNLKDRLTSLRDIHVHGDGALQLPQIRVGLSTNRQWRVIQVHHLPHIVVPHVRVNRRGLVRDSQGGVAFDNSSIQIRPAPGVVVGLFPVEHIESDGVDSHRQGHRKLQGRLQRQLDRVRPGFKD